MAVAVACPAAGADDAAGCQAQEDGQGPCWRATLRCAPRCTASARGAFLRPRGPCLRGGAGGQEGCAERALLCEGDALSEAPDCTQQDLCAGAAGHHGLSLFGTPSSVQP